MEPSRRRARRARSFDSDLGAASARAEVLAANDAFYRAMRAGDYAAMDRLWARNRPVTCTHPDWRMLVGRPAVMESWRLVLLEHRPPDIWPEGAHVVVTGSTAMVICTERVDGIALMAANSFACEGGYWRMLNHQSLVADELAEP